MNRFQRRTHIDVSVVVPAHNEESNVQPLLEQFAELAQRARFTLEVVMVDDGSTDRTLPRLVEMQKKHRFVHIVSVPSRRGLTEALQAGFSVANGGILVFYPADRQFHPNDIPRMVDKVREGYDLVTGRKIGQYNKRVVSGVYNKISRILFPSIQVTDLNSVKAFRRELINVFDYRHDWHRFWVAIVAEAGYRIGEVDVTLYKRGAGRSKFGLWRIPGGVLDLLAVKFQYHTMRRPLWYFGIIGSFLLVAAFALGLWALYQRFVMEHGYRPLLYLVMTLGIAGIVFFALGFLAESVAGIRERLELVKGMPRRSIYHPPAGRSSEPVDDRGPERPPVNARTDSRRSRGGSERGDQDRRKQPNRGPRGRGPSDRRETNSSAPTSVGTPPPSKVPSPATTQVVAPVAEPVPDERPIPSPSNSGRGDDGHQPPVSGNSSEEPHANEPAFGRRNRR